ncbi:hypothetical protein ABTD09_21245 [Acinetobacter baumannii]
MNYQTGEKGEMRERERERERLKYKEKRKLKVVGFESFWSRCLYLFFLIN